MALENLKRLADFFLNPKEIKLCLDKFDLSCDFKILETAESDALHTYEKSKSVQRFHIAILKLHRKMTEAVISCTTVSSRLLSIRVSAKPHIVQV